jgi:hypothetical protein
MFEEKEGLRVADADRHGGSRTASGVEDGRREVERRETERRVEMRRE